MGNEYPADCSGWFQQKGNAILSPTLVIGEDVVVFDTAAWLGHHLRDSVAPGLVVGRLLVLGGIVGGAISFDQYRVYVPRCPFCPRSSSVCPAGHAQPLVPSICTAKYGIPVVELVPGQAERGSTDPLGGSGKDRVVNQQVITVIPADQECVLSVQRPVR
jgi:hypothetical protein